MADTVEVPLHATAERKPSVRLSDANTATTGRGRPPLFVPRSQLYFWTRSWQAGEAEALRELADGEFFTFSDGTAAAEWLLDDAPEDEE
jgi:hypothetical protein